MADKTKVFSKRDKNVDYMNQMLPVEDSFDIVQRDIQIGGKDATFYFIDGFTKDESMLKIMDSFFNIKEEDMPKDAAAFATTCIPYVEVDVIGDFDQIFRNLYENFNLIGCAVKLYTIIGYTIHCHIFIQADINVLTNCAACLRCGICHCGL